MTDQQEDTTVSRSRTEEDITADPPIPDWSDLPTMPPNGNGDYSQADLRLAALEGWLQQESVDTITGTLAKAREYGGDGNGDLDIMAGAMRTLVPNLQNHQQALCTVLALYQLGKVARSLAALANGKMPSIDTPKDASVYARMQQKVQETGRWV